MLRPRRCLCHRRPCLAAAAAAAAALLPPPAHQEGVEREVAPLALLRRPVWSRRQRADLTTNQTPPRSSSRPRRLSPPPQRARCPCTLRAQDGTHGPEQQHTKGAGADDDGGGGEERLCCMALRPGDGGCGHRANAPGEVHAATDRLLVPATSTARRWTDNVVLSGQSTGSEHWFRALAQSRQRAAGCGGCGGCGGSGLGAHSSSPGGGADSTQRKAIDAIRLPQNCGDPPVCKHRPGAAAAAGSSVRWRRSEVGGRVCGACFGGTWTRPRGAVYAAIIDYHQW